MNINWPIKEDEWDKMVADGKAWQIIIGDWLPPSFNKLLRDSWTSYVGQRRWVQRYLSDNYGEKVPVAMGKRGIQMVIVKKSGQWDDEPNLDGRSKATLDAMVKLAMLRDDSRKFLEWHHVQEVHGSIKGVIIRLWETE